MFKVDDLMQDLILVKTIYSNLIGVESIKDPIIHVLVGSLFDAQTGPELKIVHAIYDTTRHSIIEIALEGPVSQLPHHILIYACALPTSLEVIGNQHPESLETIRERVRSLRVVTTRAALSDYASFLVDFPSVYSKVSMSVLQTQIRADLGELIGLTLSLMDQVMHFEIQRE